MTAQKFTLLIPTLNRSDFLIRGLRYYRENAFKGTILIGDSSDAEHVRALADEIVSIGSDLRVVHELCPGMNDREALKHLCDMVETPYVAYTGDDDFLVPSAIESCVEFLEGQSDYVAAQGRARNFELSGQGAFGDIKITSNYPLRGIENNTAEERLVWYLKDYRPSIFAVHRREVWQQMWQESMDIPDRSFGAELFPCCMSVVCGKTKRLDDIYLLRQSHDSHYSLPTFLDWVSSPEWAPSCRIFVSRLGAEIARRDGVPPADAEHLVKRMFSIYMYTDWGSLEHKARRFLMGMRDFFRPTEDFMRENLPAPLYRQLRRVFIALRGGISYFRRVPFLLITKAENLAYRLVGRLHKGDNASLREASEGSARRADPDRSNAVK